MSKFVINGGGPVIGQCIGDKQTISMDFTSTTTSQVTTSFFSVSQELQQKLPAEKYDAMCKEIQDVIDKYMKG